MSPYENLSSNTFEIICRTCLMHGDLFVIDEISWEAMDLKYVISYCCLQLESDVRLPNQMCRNCIRTMYETYQFLYKCRYSERVLRKILLNGSITSENEDSSAANLEPLVTELEDKHEIRCDYDEIIDDITDVKDIIEHSLETDNDIDADNPVEFESKLSNIEYTDNNLLDTTNTIKEQINNNIRVKNVLRLRQLAKARLMRYNNLPTNKSQYIFRRKGPPYICIICNASYQTHKELNRHKIETRHKKYYKYKCEYCGKTVNAYGKDEHIRTHTGEKPHKCPTCGKSFNSMTDLKRHMVTHMEVKPHVCLFCGKGFIRRQYLREHERIHTGEQLLCAFCGKGFYSYSSLSFHEKTHINMTHRDNKTYSCHLCKKEYKQQKILDAHLKLHSGKNYPCNECGKKFARRDSLAQHKRKHTGDPTYQCKVCSHISVNRRHLESHLRTHTGEKPFMCAYCGKCFGNKANMTAHTKIHTSKKNHVCKLCEKAFTNSTGLKRHMTVHEKRGKDGNDS